MNDLNPNFCVVCQCFQSPFTSQKSQEIAIRKESHLTEAEDIKKRWQQKRHRCIEQSFGLCWGW